MSEKGGVLVQASLKDYFKAYSTISRFEYIPGVAPGIFVPIFIGAASLSIVLTPLFFEAVLVFTLLYFSGFVINSLVDREMDVKYNTFKGKIAESVNLLGTGAVKGILGIQVGLSLLLSLHISIVLQNPWIIFLVSLGVLFGIGYSARPFHFKVKGVWHAISLASSAFFIPLLFLYLVITTAVEILDILVLLGITIAHYSMEMGNQAADHLEDLQEGLLTPTVRMGLDKALKASIIMTTVGMLFTISAVAAMYMTTGFSETVGLGTGLEALPVMGLVLIVMAVVIGLGYYIPIKGLKDLYGYSIDLIPLSEQVARIKARIEYAKWQASGIIGVVIVLGVLFSATLQAPVMDQNVLVNDIPDDVAELDINQLRIDNVVVTTRNDGMSSNEAQLTVRLKMSIINDKSALKQVQAYVDAGSGNEIFATSSGNIDNEGRATITIRLQGHNESKVWYFAYLIYNEKRSSYTYTKPSESVLYIFDARLKKVDEVLLQDKFQLDIKCFNAGPVRAAGTITLKVVWAPLVDYELVYNNDTVRPRQVWETSTDEWLFKDLMSDSSSVKIYLYYDDKQFDEMHIQF